VLHFHRIVTLCLFVIPKVGRFRFAPEWKLMASVMTIPWHLPQFCQKVVPPSLAKAHNSISLKWAYKVVVGLIYYLFRKYQGCLRHGCFYKKISLKMYHKGAQWYISIQWWWYIVRILQPREPHTMAVQCISNVPGLAFVIVTWITTTPLWFSNPIFMSSPFPHLLITSWFPVG